MNIYKSLPCIQWHSWLIFFPRIQICESMSWSVVGRLEVRPAYPKLNVGLFSKTMHTVPSFHKLGMIAITLELYTPMPLLVIFDLCTCYMVDICTKLAISVSQQPLMSSRWSLLWIESTSNACHINLFCLATFSSSTDNCHTLKIGWNRNIWYVWKTI